MARERFIEVQPATSFAEDPPPEKMSEAKRVWQITRSALESTSLKGVPRIFKAKYRPLKVLWLVSTLGFLAFVCYQVAGAFVEYLSNATVINIQEKWPSGDDSEESSLDFPMITLCNLKVVHNMYNGSGISVEEYITQMATNASQWTRTHGPPDPEAENALQYMGTVAAYYEYIGRARAIEYGTHLEDFILSCNVRSDIADMSFDCSTLANFTLISTPENFNCYTIGVGKEQVELYQPYKMTLLLYVDSDDHFISKHYDTKFNDLQANGVKISLHSRKEVYDIKKKGLSVPPGMLSTINVEISERERLGGKYGPCIPNLSKSYYDREGGELPYTRRTCYSACIQSKITQICNCLDPSSLATVTLEESQLLFCARSKDSFEERFSNTVCAQRTKKSHAPACYEECQVACEEMIVTTTVTYAQWPRLSQQLALYEEFIRGRSFASKFSMYEEIVDNFTATQDDEAALEALSKVDKMEKNFLMVDIILSKLGTTIVADQIKTSESDMVSTIGSLLNLYSGITVIVIVEVLDLLYCIIAHFACGSKEQEKTSNKPAKDKQERNGHSISVVL